MNAIARLAAITMLVASTSPAGQEDPARVLADTRAALGGDKLGSVTSLVGTGRTTRIGPGGRTTEAEFEVALSLPDKFRLRTALMPLGNMTVYRDTGFNAHEPIEAVDTPPNLAGGHVTVSFRGPGGPLDPDKMTPEQKAEARRATLSANLKEYARLTLGMFAASPEAYPLEFRYAGQAEAPDGKADVIDVRGDDGFSARLFVDATTHLPLMLSWTDKEPLVLTAGGAHGAEVGVAVQSHAAGGGPGRMSREDLDRFKEDLEARRAEAEAKRRTVEYRLYYADYRPVAGVKLPHRIQRAIDGKTTEEMAFDHYRINSKIAASTFEPTR